MDGSYVLCHVTLEHDSVKMIKICFCELSPFWRTFCCSGGRGCSWPGCAWPPPCGRGGCVSSGLPWCWISGHRGDIACRLDPPAPPRPGPWSQGSPHQTGAGSHTPPPETRGQLDLDNFDYWGVLWLYSKIKLIRSRIYSFLITSLMWTGVKSMPVSAMLLLTMSCSWVMKVVAGARRPVPGAPGMPGGRETSSGGSRVQCWAIRSRDSAPGPSWDTGTATENTSLWFR